MSSLNDMFSDLEESSKEPVNDTVKKTKRTSKKKVSEEPLEEVKQNSEEDSLISKELERFEKQVNEMFLVLESTNLLMIPDVEERLKSAKTKMDIELKIPLLLNGLNDLRTKDKLKQDQIKGNKKISPLEGGLLD